MTRIRSLFWQGLGATALMVMVFVSPSKSLAGVFDLPSFVDPGAWSVGAEGEVVVSGGTGAGLNLKPRWGATNFLNWEGLIGIGSGARNFRLGVTADVEWFPDYGEQPGIATPAFLEYYSYKSSALWIAGFKPMIYKTFEGKDADYTPFFAVPFGWNFVNAGVQPFFQVAMGSQFKMPDVDQWRFSLEAGFNAQNSYSYISGGVTYYQ